MRNKRKIIISGAMNQAGDYVSEIAYIIYTSQPWWLDFAIKKRDGQIIVARIDAISTSHRHPLVGSKSYEIQPYAVSRFFSGERVQYTIDLEQADIEKVWRKKRFAKLPQSPHMGIATKNNRPRKNDENHPVMWDYENNPIIFK